MKRYVFALVLTIAAFASNAQAAESLQQKQLFPDIKDDEIEKYAGMYVGETSQHT